MRVVEVDENTKVPLRVVWTVGGAALVFIAWLGSNSMTASSAKADARDNRDAIIAIQKEREVAYERYTENLIEIKSKLSGIEQELKDLKR